MEWSAYFRQHSLEMFTPFAPPSHTVSVAPEPEHQGVPVIPEQKRGVVHFAAACLSQHCSHSDTNWATVSFPCPIASSMHWLPRVSFCVAASRSKAERKNARDSIGQGYGETNRCKCKRFESQPLEPKCITKAKTIRQPNNPPATWGGERLLRVILFLCRCALFALRCAVSS